MSSKGGLGSFYPRASERLWATCHFFSGTYFAALPLAHFLTIFLSPVFILYQLIPDLIKTSNSGMLPHVAITSHVLTFLLPSFHCASFPAHPCTNVNFFTPHSSLPTLWSHCKISSLIKTNYLPIFSHPSGPKHLWRKKQTCWWLFSS